MKQAQGGLSQHDFGGAGQVIMLLAFLAHREAPMHLNEVKLQI